MATFLPWAASGSRIRNSYEVVDVADRAGVVPGSMAFAAGAWFLVPAACGLVLVAGALGRVRLAAGLAATLGAVVTVGGVLVVRSPLGTEPGAVVGVVVGGATVLAGVVALGAAGKAGRKR